MYLTPTTRVEGAAARADVARRLTLVDLDLIFTLVTGRQVTDLKTLPGRDMPATSVTHHALHAPISACVKAARCTGGAPGLLAALCHDVLTATDLGDLVHLVEQDADHRRTENQDLEAAAARSTTRFNRLDLVEALRWACTAPAVVGYADTTPGEDLWQVTTQVSGLSTAQATTVLGLHQQSPRTPLGDLVTTARAIHA